MLKKHNKLIMLLVLVTFMFTMVGSAGAASFSDVTGNTDETAAIYRLNGLGIVNGYPDGTFGPEKTITRAEFAKIACTTAGLKDVASGMGGTASSFSDVATDHWANGWINVAAAQGFVKGDPAGTFRPEDQITQAEVITVLLRLLGYNDNLPGEWPSDYIAKAANLGILDDVTFVASQPATRGLVAVVTSATLDENVVEYVASDNIFNEAKKNNETYTLLQDSFKGVATADPVIVYDLDLSDGDQAIKIVDPSLTKTKDIQTAIDEGTFKSYTLADDCVISGADSILGVAGRFVEFTLNDDNEVVYIGVKENDDYKIVKGLDPDKIKRVSTNSVKVDNGKTYKVADTFAAYSSNIPAVMHKVYGTYTAGAGVKVGTNTVKYTREADTGFLGGNTTDTMPITSALLGKTIQQSAGNGDKLKAYLENVMLAAESVDFVLNDDGEIAYVNFNVWATAPNPTLDTTKAVGLIDNVSTKNGKITLKNGGSFTLDADDPDNQYIVKNGKVVELSDLAENDMVWFMDKYGTDTVIAMSLTVSGEFDSYTDTTFLGKAMVNKVDVGDKTYSVIKGGGLISSDDGDSFEALTDSTGAIVEDLDDATGGDVTLYLSPSMTVAAIMVGEGGGTSGSIYGVVNDNNIDSLVNGKVTASIEVILPDGTYATYAPDSDSEIETYNSSTDKTTKAKLTKAVVTGSDLEPDTLVQITLNSDGYIDVLRIGKAIKNYTDFGLAGASANITGDKDEMTITVNKNSYDTSKAVIFNTSLTKTGATPDDDEVDTVDLDEFMDNADSTITNSTGIYGVVRDGEIRYLVFNNSNVLGSNNKLGMVAGKGTNKDGAYVQLLTTGDAVKYTVKTGSDTTYFKKGQVINYNLSSGDVKILDPGTNWAQFAVKAVIDKVSGNIFKIDGVNYSVDKDTLYFDYTEDDPVVAVKGDFAAGDEVIIYQEKADGPLGAIVLVD